MATSVPAIALLLGTLEKGHVLDIYIEGEDQRVYDGGLTKDEIIHVAEDGIIYRTNADNEVVYIPMSRINHLSVNKMLDFENDTDFIDAKKKREASF
jgi:hypothetical protein